MSGHTDTPGRGWRAPFVRRSTYTRRFAELGQTYRGQIDQARRDLDRARTEHQQWVDLLAPRISTHMPVDRGLLITIEVDRRVLAREPMQEIAALVRDSVMRRLLEAGRDYRGDMRQTEAQRLFGVAR